MSGGNFTLSTLKRSDEIIPNGRSFEIAHLEVLGHWPGEGEVTYGSDFGENYGKWPNFKDVFLKSLCELDPTN